MSHAQHRPASTPKLALASILLALPLLVATACTETQADVAAELNAGESDVAERPPREAGPVTEQAEDDGRGFFGRLSGDDRPETVQIPSGTPLTVRLDQPVASHVTAEGQSLRGELTADVTVGERTVLPAGAVVWAAVAQARPHAATDTFGRRNEGADLDRTAEGSEMTGEGSTPAAEGSDPAAEGSDPAAEEPGGSELERDLRTPAESGEPALIEISFERVETKDGRWVPISATWREAGPAEPSDGPTAGTASAEVMIPAGTEITVALVRATSVELFEEEAD